MKKIIQPLTLLLFALCSFSCEKDNSSLKQIEYTYWSVMEDDCIYLRFNNVWSIIEVYEFDSAPTIKGKTLTGPLSYGIDDYVCFFYKLKGDELYLDVSSQWEDEVSKYKKASYTFKGKDMLIIQCDGHEFFDEAITLKNTHCKYIDNDNTEYID